MHASNTRATAGDDPRLPGLPWQGTSTDSYGRADERDSRVGQRPAERPVDRVVSLGSVSPANPLQVVRPTDAACGSHGPKEVHDAPGGTRDTCQTIEWGDPQERRRSHPRPLQGAVPCGRREPRRDVESWSLCQNPVMPPASA